MEFKTSAPPKTYTVFGRSEDTDRQTIKAIKKVLVRYTDTYLYLAFEAASIVQPEMKKAFH